LSPTSTRALPGRRLPPTRTWMNTSATCRSMVGAFMGLLAAGGSPMSRRSVIDRQFVVHEGGSVQDTGADDVDGRVPAGPELVDGAQIQGSRVFPRVPELDGNRDHAPEEEVMRVHASSLHLLGREPRKPFDRPKGPSVLFR